MFRTFLRDETDFCIVFSCDANVHGFAVISLQFGLQISLCPSSKIALLTSDKAGILLGSVFDSLSHLAWFSLSLDISERPDITQAGAFSIIAIMKGIFHLNMVCILRLPEKMSERNDNKPADNKLYPALSL